MPAVSFDDHSAILACFNRNLRDHIAAGSTPLAAGSTPLA